MPDSSSTIDPQPPEDDSRGGLWVAIRRFLNGEEEEQSLRAQLEEAIDEKEKEEGEDAANGEHPLNGDLSPVERQMLRNMLHFNEHDADDVAIPRSEIIAISAKASWDEMVGTFAEHGISRMPVYRESLDEVIGMMLIKDVFNHLAGGQPPPRDWTRMMRQPLFVPQARNALDVLADMRSSRVHLAVVLDEFSGTDGIITFEDLVEEIVGEIEDEHDEDPVEQIFPIGDGMWDADARVELDDIAKRVDPALAEVDEQVDTLGGLAFVLAEQVPEVGAMLDHPSGWRIEVIAGDETHVTRLRLHPPATEDDEEE